MNISSNIRKLTLLFIVLFMALSAGLVYWQVIVAGPVSANIHNSRVCLQDNAPIRGRIFDRNGVLLAESVPSATCGYVRKYYDSSLAGLIGYYVSPLYPSTGIEHQFDDYLNGKIGMTALDNTINKTLHRPPVGNDIYLTIDERIQKVANQHFDDPNTLSNTFQSNRGSVVVSDPHTGEILAMVSRPTFDPNKVVNTLIEGDLTYFNSLLKDKDQPLLERPINGTYIPGSTYKTVTLMAALENGATTLDQPFDKEHALGPIFIKGDKIGPTGNNIEGYTFRFPVTTEYGFTHSDNVIFAQVGVQTGAQKWLDYNKKFYVGGTIPFDLPVTPSSVLKPDTTELADNELAENAFGQGFDNVTPLQMTLFNNAVANDGKLMRPMVIAKITDHDKNPVKTYSSEQLFQGLSSQNAAAVRQAMFGVIRCGSGIVVPPLFNSPISIIGKTGSAQVAALDQNIPAHSWMITQAPYLVSNPSQLPALTIVAMKENAGEGGNAIGPMTAKIYEDVFNKKYVQAPSAPPPPGMSYCSQTGLYQ